MASSVNNPGTVSPGLSGQAGAAEYDPPPSRLLQIFLFCAFLLTAGAYIVGQRSDFTTEDTVNRMRDAKLNRLEVDKHKFLAYTKLGYQALEQNHFDVAVSNFQSAVLLQNTGEAHRNLGNALLGQAKTNEALKEFQIALSLDPKLKIAENKGTH